MANEKLIQVKGIDELSKAFKKIGETKKKQRTEINKALRPAAKIAVRSLTMKYKHRPKHVYPPGTRFVPGKGMQRGNPTYKTIGIITAKSKQPGLFVGVRLKNVFPHYVRGKASKNLAAMLVEKGAPDYHLEVVKEKGEQIANTAERDLDKLLDKIFKKAGFR